MMRERSEIIDVSKGIGILLVFVGHSIYCCTSGFKIIFSFHMPLFFCLSGLVFCRSAMLPFKEFCLRGLRGLIFPYLIFNMLALLTAPVRELPQGQAGHTALKIAASILFGHSWLNGPSWFLISMFAVRLISWGLIRIKLTSAIKTFLVLCFFVSGSFLAGDVPYFIYRYANPFQMITLPAALLFFWCGVRSSEAFASFQHKNLEVMFSLLLIFIAVPVLCLVVLRLPNVGIDSGKVGHVILSPIMALLAISLVLCMVHVFPVTVRRLLAWVGRNSLYYFLLEFIIGSYVVLLFPSELCLGFPLYKCQTNITTAIVFALCNLIFVSVCLVPVKKAYGMVNGLFWSK